jgi:hypothetical protein
MMALVIITLAIGVVNVNTDLKFKFKEDCERAAAVINESKAVTLRASYAVCVVGVVGP